MIYVDTSVILAELLAEDRHPSEAFWSDTLVSSRLLEYEVWVRVHARRLTRTHAEAARALVGRVALLEFLRERDPGVRLATYDARQAAAAVALGIGLYDLDAGD